MYPGDIKSFIVFCFRKRKAEDVPDAPSKKIKTEEEELVRKQNKKMFKLRDQLKTLKKKELFYLLEHNDQYIPPGESNVSVLYFHFSSCEWELDSENFIKVPMLLNFREYVDNRALWV